MANALLLTLTKPAKAMRVSVPSNRRVTFFKDKNIAKISFNKPAFSWKQQVDLLMQRGMGITDSNKAELNIKHLNYYRLSAYWLPFEADHEIHLFKPGTRFEEVLNLYTFDRQLRLIVLDAIEHIEVSIRSAWAYNMARTYGPHAHLNPDLAFNTDYFKKNLELLIKEVKRSDETFIKHYRNTYSEALPPIWATCEVMSLGQLSRWYNNLKPMQVRKEIANTYNIDESLLASWLQHLSLIRNICAHHSRLWNREFTVTPAAPKNKPSGLKAQWIPSSRKLYNSLVILLYCMDIVAVGSHWRTSLKDLIGKHNIPVTEMGFPGNWQKFPIWK